MMQKHAVTNKRTQAYERERRNISLFFFSVKGDGRKEERE
jgi:hypothetical protein